jgi:hypothetical protein
MLTASLRAAAAAAFAVMASLCPAQAPMTRFFMLPDNGPAFGSDSMFTGTAGATNFAFDFADPIRLNHGGFVTMSQDAGNPFVWNVLDFEMQATDLLTGSRLVFERMGGGPHGTWTSSSSIGFPDFETVTITMTGALTTTGPLAGAFPPTATLTLSGTITPGFYHNVVQLTGGFTGIPGPVAMFMKNDFFPPSVIWEMVGDEAQSSATVGAPPGPAIIRGGVSLQRGIATPNVYGLLNLAFEAVAVPPVVIGTPTGMGAGTLTLDPATRVLTGSLNVLVDGVPTVIAIDGVGDSFTGSAMRPTSLVIDEAGPFGPLSGLHLRIAATEIVPADPPINDFQIGLTTSVVMRGRAGHFYACGASFSSLPGINTPVGDIPVMGDDLLFLSLDPTNPFFLNMVGIMPPSGAVLISVVVPADPILIGATFFLGGATFNPVTFDVLAATNSHRAIIK